MKDSIKNLIRIYNLRDDSVVHLHSQDRCKSCKLSDIEDYKESVFKYYFNPKTLILSLWL